MSAWKWIVTAGAAAWLLLAAVALTGSSAAARAPVAVRSAASALPEAPPAPPTLAECLKAVGLACYSPQELQRAYHLGPLYAQGLNGKGSTIVIVDPFGSPTIGHDLSVFDRAFGLPDPPALRVLQPVGSVPPFDPSNEAMLVKAGETTLDVEWSHAIAPKANILLVETPVRETVTGGGFPQYLAAENYVINHNLGDVISQSFSLPEQNFPSRGFVRKLRYAYVNADRHRVTVLAATNDNGVTGPTRTGHFYGHRIVQWPATDPLVTGVGGTELHLDTAGKRTEPDTAWNDTWDPALVNLFGQPPPLPWASNGGVSTIFSRPSYQDQVRRTVGDRRGVPDVAMSASFSGAVLAFQSYTGKPGWVQVGGTSEATPEFAGIVAIADEYARTRLGKRRLGLINRTLYRIERRHERGLVDVTKGNNTVSFVAGATGSRTVTVRGYRAKPGYDLVTGIGTIDAARFVPELAKLG